MHETITRKAAELGRNMPLRISESRQAVLCGNRTARGLLAPVIGGSVRCYRREAQPSGSDPRSGIDRRRSASNLEVKDRSAAC